MVKNSKIYNGKQNHKCKACGRWCVDDPQPRRISEETERLVGAMLLEKIPRAGIRRAMKVSPRRLRYYVNEPHAQVERRVGVQAEQRCADPVM